jgi:hypothetical protein
MSNSNHQKRRDIRRRPVPPEHHIRVRSKRLDEIDADKISLAFWLLAKQLVEDHTDEPTTTPLPASDDADEVAA